MPTIHPKARTTPSVRAEIARSREPTGVLAQRYSVSTETIRKWRKRGPQDCQDRSSRPRKLPWKATDEERAIVRALRRATGFPLDDLTLLGTPVLPHLTRDGVSRFLKAEGLGRPPPADRARRSQSRFKAYDLGFVHVDVKPLPKLRPQDGQSRKRYLYVAIDRASRFVHLAVKDDETERSAVAFLTEAIRAFPFQVTHVLTDRGSCFTADGFEAACQTLGVEHRKTRPYTPRTNGMVERFKGRVPREVWGIAVARPQDWASRWPATRIWKPCCTASIRPTTLVGNVCSRADPRRGSCPSASPRSPPTLAPVTIRHSIPAACPRPFR